MKSKSRPLVWSLTVLMLLMLSISCASSKKEPDPIADLRNWVRTEVGDPTRSAEMLASVDELESLTGEVSAMIEKEREELTPMLRDYSTSRDQLEAKLAELNEGRAALAQRMLDAHLALKAAATAEEWKKLRKLEKRALQRFASESLGREAILVEGD